MCTTSLKRVLFALIALALPILSLTSCVADYVDLESFDKFTEAVFPTKADSGLSDEIDLYVDYSTCVAEASTSEFFKATHPAIVDCNPNYYSIKGKVIKLETNDRNKSYELLRTIKEVNNADLKTAVSDITSTNHQAVLITDGEYFPNNVIKDNLDNPYLAPYIRSWIKADHDIYIYSEPYVESQKHNKFRYYMIFTDADIENNLNDKFVRSAPEASDVLVLHLGSGVPVPKFSKKFPVINPTLSATETPVKNNVFIDTALEWDDILKYMRTEDIDEDYFLRGLSVNNLSEECFAIKKIKAVVYQLYDQYQEFSDSVAIGGHLPQFKPDEFEELENIFEIDDKLLKKKGEIAIKIHEDFDGEDLSTEHNNLLKVDLVIDEADDNFSDNSDMKDGFIWNSISAANNHAPNTSLYQSISQVLRDPKMNPEKSHKPFFTFYIQTPKF